MDFAVPVDHRVKIKESKKMNKYLNLTWEQKNQWNMKMMVIPIIVGVLGTVPKGFSKDMRNWRLEEVLKPYKPQHC